MKKLIILLLFFTCAFSLFAATSSHDANIYVPPVEGGREKDQSFFLRQVTYEVVLNYYTVAKSRQNSNYFLRGTIDSEAEMNLRRSLHEKRIERAVEIIDNYNRNLHIQGEYYFMLELVDSETEEPLAAQYLVYMTTEDEGLVELVQLIVRNLLSNLPKYILDNTWREKWLFLGVNALWLPRIYVGDNREVNWATFGFAVYFEFHFLNFLSATLEPQFVRDWVVVSHESGEQYTDYMIEIPITIKYVGKWFNNFTIEPYTGISFNFSTMGSTVPSIASWLAGIQMGIKAGPGMIVIDPRFAMDLTKSHLPENENNIEYNRYMIQLALGYKFGLVNKEKKKNTRSFAPELR